MRERLALGLLLLLGLQSATTALAQERGRPEGRPNGATAPQNRPDANRSNAPARPAPRAADAPRPTFAPQSPQAGRAPAAPRAPNSFNSGRPAFDGRGQLLDGRYNHGRYYPPIGTTRPSLPPDYRPYYRGRDRYYFNGGIWYAPRGPGFVVVRPPPGLVISVLPSYYSTVWIGGSPYYYADNVYYSWQPDQSGYAVVDPPENADVPTAPPDAAQDDLIIYPKNGQTKEQQAADQYECHSWAKGQTNFDPTEAGGGVAPEDLDRARGNYNRAISACLQGRGYQVN